MTLLRLVFLAHLTDFVSPPLSKLHDSAFSVKGVCSNSFGAAQLYAEEQSGQSEEKRIHAVPLSAAGLSCYETIL